MLTLVATPIGNLRDITLRAIDTLRGADYILAEDTRVCKKLLHHYGIKAKVVSFHKFNEKSKQKSILDDLKTGLHIALVSDAGHPGIADPGALLVQACLQENLPVTINPGASSVSAAMSLSGEQGPFQFYGFFPKKKQKELLEKVQNYPGTTLFFESAKRIVKTLEALDKETKVMILREITKKFETLIKCSAGEATSKVQECLKGEFVLLIFGEPKKNTFPIQEVFEELTPYMSKKDAARLASKFTGTNKKQILW